jgi:hypothetical protein
MSVDVSKGLVWTNVWNNSTFIEDKPPAPRLTTVIEVVIETDEGDYTLPIRLTAIPVTNIVEFEREDDYTQEVINENDLSDLNAMLTLTGEDGPMYPVVIAGVGENRAYLIFGHQA